MHESARITQSNEQMIENRKLIFEILNRIEFTDDEKQRLLPMFLSSSKLARIFAIYEVYEQIIDIPGSILDLGTWRGETMIICENLRAILEPFNKQRRVIGFDTFQGYEGFQQNETNSKYHKNGTYDTGKDYETILKNLIEYHQGSNVMGHLKIHKVIKGDVRKTLPQFFKSHQNEIVSLAFFDLNNYEPTEIAFKSIYEKLIKGGILVFWQLTRDKEVVSAEGKFFNDFIRNLPFKIKKSKFYPSLSYIIKE